MYFFQQGISTVQDKIENVNIHTYWIFGKWWVKYGNKSFCTDK